MAEPISEPLAERGSEDVLELIGVHKFYGIEVRTEVLKGVDLRVRRGELVALMGPSGSGKSTLLNILGLLDRPSSGSVRILGEDASEAGDDTRTRLRATRLGFVFQFHHLLPALTAEENVRMPLAVAQGWVVPGQRARALELLDAVGLREKAGALPGQLSGGQQQRVAIARALAHRPPLVLADEPTGNLDTETSAEVFEVLRRANRELGTAFLVVTHDPRIAERCQRVVTLVDGRIVADRQNGG